MASAAVRQRARQQQQLLYHHEKEDNVEKVEEEAFHHHNDESKTQNQSISFRSLLFLRRRQRKKAIVNACFLLTVSFVFVWSIRKQRHRFHIRRHQLITPESRLSNNVTLKLESNLQQLRQAPTSQIQQQQQDQLRGQNVKILTIYAESPSTLDIKTLPLPPRNTTAESLTKYTYPKVRNCNSLEQFPVDDFPNDDPFLPWIHDYFVNEQRTHVTIVAQNKRRCQTGRGNEQAMEHWEPQMALFQPVPVRVETLENSNGRGTHLRYSLSSLENATHSETRFLCHFHNKQLNETTLSVFAFNYEFVSWRKHRGLMFETSGGKGDTSKLETSQLVFYCPIPDFLKKQQQTSPLESVDFYLDIVPIRTPARRQFLLTPDHVGPKEWSKLTPFDVSANYGNHVLPEIADSGRWANLPLCWPPLLRYSSSVASISNSTIDTAASNSDSKRKRHRLVACTWAAASYHRRGDVAAVHDTSRRLREWIAFHRLVGLDHLYIYDNTQHPMVSNDTIHATTYKSPLEDIAKQEDQSFVTYIPWKPKICNNNRPQHAVPGERSSQYAAEASCRERYGSQTDWLVFMDIDEYLVPMGNDTWNAVLDKADEDGVKALKLKSARGRPRLEFMDEMPANSESQACENMIDARVSTAPEPCLVPRSNETILRVYNCDYIKLPRPERFSRAMKQIYRPDFVLQHFVHYSCVTTHMATYYKDRHDKETFQKGVKSEEWADMFVDELSQGVLVHTKSVLPHETIYRNRSCYLGSKTPCPLGIACPASTPFVFGQHQSNSFHDERGEYCNCWVNEKLEKLILKLERALM
ncbi:hypothetical protein MPSEU_000909900 [Mayamaea pseudoterrestris]|nr:hypothetical protein MPSEU_000909900 [Mayamaea pseudoterrestris]